MFTGIAFGGVEIALERFEIGFARAERLTQILEGGDLQAAGVEHPERGRRETKRGALGNVGEVTAQKGKAEVRRDALPFAQPELEELLDRPAGHDDGYRFERIAKLVFVHQRGDRSNQLFQAIRVVQMNHREKPAADSVSARGASSADP